MIVSHKHKFIFFCTPKTGSTSLESKLSSLNQESWAFSAKGTFDAKHIPPSYIKAIVSDEVWHDYFKFCFVRNPYDWFVSQFKYNYPSAKFRVSYLMRYPWRAKAYINTYRYYRNHSNKNEYLVEDVCMLYDFLKNCRGITTNRSLEQSIYAYDKNGNSLVDFVGRFETLNEDVETIQEKIGLRFNLPHLNKTVRASFKSYLPNDSMKKIEELWENDFRYFNYTKESI